MKSEREVAQSYPTLCDPMDCSLPGSSAHGIFQARVLERGAIAFSRLQYRSLQFLQIPLQVVGLPSEPACQGSGCVLSMCVGVCVCEGLVWVEGSVRRVQGRERQMSGSPWRPLCSWMLLLLPPCLGLSAGSTAREGGGPGPLCIFPTSFVPQGVKGKSPVFWSLVVGRTSMAQARCCGYRQGESQEARSPSPLLVGWQDQPELVGAVEAES